jgi:hypothetical protein
MALFSWQAVALILTAAISYGLLLFTVGKILNWVFQND